MRCKRSSGESCPMLVYITEDGKKKADGGMFQKYCYYCLETPRTKKIGHAAQWSGSTPKWCPLGRG